MRNENDSDTGFLQFPDLREQPLGVRASERSRWFIENQDLAFVGEPSRNLDQLLLPDPKLTDRDTRVQIYLSAARGWSVL